ncbi:MAG: 2-isopropylmalate synthase [Acidobacteria bacterium]|nr:2-isopropylmalate synthase [Acidobacteriota bacterium]
MGFVSMDEGLIYDWNLPARKIRKKVRFCDETLRDGLQSPSVRHPSTAEKLEILHLMEEIGIESVDIGLPGAGGQMSADTEVLAREIAGNRMKMRPNCAARTALADIEPIVSVSQRTGIPIEVAMFIGSSPIRQYAEDWNLELMLRRSEEAIRFAKSYNLPVMFVTEDTVRAHPDDIKKLYGTAISLGVEAIVVCDTVGHATPRGAQRIVKFVRQEIIRASGRRVRLEWHGHNDRGLGVINSIAAVEAGADQVHGTALGIGERVGNTAMDLLLVNFQLLGYVDRDLRALKHYCETVSKAVGIPIPPNYPVFGSDAFRTATGVHAAAVIKALQKNDRALANVVYSGVPSHFFGLDQIIEIGPMSGKSNVSFWLKKKGIEPTEERVERVFALAKESTRLLSEEEILAAAYSGAIPGGKGS